ncbi:MAG: PqqD family protein [Lachnospiraceae bacterium]|nr:PqqD family protein [Lachnospiraceae bacterium]
MKEQLQTPEQPEGLSRKTYQASQNFIHRKIADSDVLISVGSNIANFNGYIELNGSAADLWEKLQTPSRPDELEQLLETKYGISHETAAEHVLDFLKELQEHDMVVVK